jgi:flagellar biosynthesis chaperone FliJ
MQKLQNNISTLKTILSKAITQIKNKEANNLSNNWKNTNEYSKGVSENYKNLQLIGSKCLPENEKDSWIKLWSEAFVKYDKIINESNACGVQLKMIEEYKPEEVDEITDSILKHTPLNYSIVEADKYEKEYLQAIQEIKNEVSQKKNLWDKFLDILAGGTQQTPAQRVMMQRWVNGERDN